MNAGGIDGSPPEIWKRVMTEKYADFDGRARRKEYWWFVAMNIVVYIALLILTIILGAISSALAWVGVLAFVIFGLAVFIPTLAALARRLHDTGKPTWMIVFSFLGPLGLVNFVFALLDGDKGSNEFGPSPKYGA